MSYYNLGKAKNLKNIAIVTDKTIQCELTILKSNYQQLSTKKE